MKNNYKDTLLMPKTNFEMRANLNQKEPIIQEFWLKNSVYENILSKNKNKKPFILHDGPPYANGNLHLGHALNKTLKDIIIRYYNSNNYFAPYVPGWDTHGLPIEQAVSKKNDRKTMKIVDFRNACQAYAQEQVKIQKEQFKRLGLLSDFKNIYITFEKKYESEQIKLFAKMVEKKLVYRNLYPVYWSTSSETALAEAEIEYINKKSPAVFIAFEIVNSKNNLLIDENTNIVIWTTTPWTIPFNQLLAINKDFIYQLILVNNKKYVIAKDLVNNFIKNNKFEEFKILNEFLGKELTNFQAVHPLNKQIRNIVHSDHVNLESGTGVVHIACGFGVDDFNLGQKHNIKPLVAINDQGIITKEINDKELENKFYDDTNKIIVERLKDNNHLVGFNWITHSYPHDWRTKKPVIYRATSQWFVSVSKLKDQLLEIIKEINFIPEWGQKRMELMMKNRNDWVISRQRVWGVPIPIFYSENKNPILDPILINHVADLFATHGSNIWYEKDVNDLLPKNYKHEESPNGIFYKEQDIMDVWFDSGVSHLNFLNKYSLSSPFDLYLEGNDQFRGWFNSSLITSTIYNGKSPYKTALAHGFVNDEKGNKMSKSLGNIISVQDICNQYGADILRLWVSSVDYQDDIKIGNDILKQISENYRKIRNILRFLLGNLFDFDVNKYKEISLDKVLKDLNEIDCYILNKLNNLITEVHKCYKNYDFNTIYTVILNFISNDLSAFYCDFTKDILYVSTANDIRRKQVQTTMFYICNSLISLLSPILPHTCEEAYQNLYYNSWDKKQDSLFLNLMVEPLNIKLEDRLIKKWDLFMKLRDDVNQALTNSQKQGIIKNTLEAKVVINFKNQEIKSLMQTIENQELSKLLIVSESFFNNEKNANPILTNNNYDIEISLKKGTKCTRCWLIVEEIKEDICFRCYNVLNN